MNPLLESAQSIGEEMTEEQREAAPVKKKAPTLAEFDPENPPMPDNGNASFERFMGSFGTPNRWAGR